MADALLVEFLQPLLAALEGGRHQRIVARPGLVMVDRADATAPLLVAWDAAQHHRVRELLVEPIVLESGATATWAGEALVILNPPNAMRRSEDWVREGGISSLAARFLSGSLGVGKNILLVGPQGVVQDAVAALLADGKRPAVLGPQICAVPRSWGRVEHVNELPLYGADRVGAWLATQEEVARLLSVHSGVVAYLNARRLERALMRLENALGVLHGAPATPLQVLAGLDLVAVLSDTPTPKVTEIYEIALTEDGYRPRPLFLSGLVPAPQALVPVAAPSFLDELAQAGHALLADELRHAVPSQARANTLPEGQRESSPASVSPVAVVPVVESPAKIDLGPISDEPPGWELDQVPEADLEAEQASQNSDGATLAATYGLGPPPRPIGVRGSDGGGFEEALRRAREREEGQE